MTLPFRALVLLFLVAMALPSPSRAEDRAESARRVADLVQNGRLEAALEKCRTHNDLFAGDAVMLYNQACLENRAGDAAAAVATFRRALAAGFTNLQLARTDPDLQGIAAADIAEAIDAEGARLTRRSRDLGVELDFESWSTPMRLTVDPPRPDAVSSPAGEPELRLRWVQTGLELELIANGDVLSSDGGAPWNGGPGLIVTLSGPIDGASYECSNSLLFAFGVEKSTSVGALFVSGPGRDRWQWVRELDPKIRVDVERRTELKVTIPWQALEPYHPLVDTPLGFNATLRGPAGQGRFSLFENTDLDDAAATSRRVVPLAFRRNSLPEDALRGKVSNAISGGDPIELHLVAVSHTAGPARLEIDFVNDSGASVLGEGPRIQPVELVTGVNHLSRQADFSRLRTGPYRLRAELTYPSGGKGTWSTAVLHLAGNWRQDLDDRILNLPASETATAAHHMAAVVQAVSDHGERQNPGAIATTLSALQSMLDAAEAGGSILPQTGSFLFVASDQAGPGQDLYHLALPPGRPPAGPTRPVVILTDRPAEAVHLVTRIMQNYENGEPFRGRPARTAGDAWPVYVVPQLDPDVVTAPDRLLDASRACAAWALAYFEADGLSLAGVDRGGVAALRLTGETGLGIDNVLIFAGEGMDPWPQAEAAFLRERLGPAPAAASVTWADFIRETQRGQAPAILAAIRELGYPVGDVIEIRGSLNLTQVADRTAQWVAGSDDGKDAE